MVRNVLAFVVAILLSQAQAWAQVPPGGMPGLAPQIPTLSRADVEKLIAITPDLAKLGGQRMSAGGINPMAQPSPEDVKQLEALLSRYGFGFPDFFMKMTVLLATYHTLVPAEFERQLPNEQSPEVQKVLADPNVPDSDKKLLKEQIAQLQANKGAMREQFAAMATPENQAAVRPLLTQVKRALDEAEAVSRQAREKAVQAPPAAAPGPRKAKSATPTP